MTDAPRPSELGRATHRGSTVVTSPLPAPLWAADCFRNRAGHLRFLHHSNRIGPTEACG